MKFQNIIEKVRAGLLGSGRWLSTHVDRRLLLFAVMIVVGLLSGFGAYLLKHLIAALSRLLTAGLDSYSFNWILLILPLLGIVGAGALVRYLLRTPLSHGPERLKAQLKQGDLYIAPKRMFYPMIASTITLGFGGSAGSEGPIASTGAAIGGNIGRWLNLDRATLATVIGIGAGAGIAGIFKSPLGGAFYTLEVMRTPMTTLAVLALLVCTIVASMTAYALGGFKLDIQMADSFASFDPKYIPFVIALGIVCGLYALYYRYIMATVRRWLEAIKREWVRWVIAGTFLSVAVAMLPALYGEGYGVAGSLLNGHSGALLADSMFATSSGGATLLIFVAFATVAVKCFATSATNNGGGVAGNFAPTLMVGSVLGFLFVLLVNAFCGFDLPVGLFVLYSMAGVMAGAVRAPLMAVMLCTEMVGAYSQFFPMIIVVTISYAIVRIFEKQQ